MMLPARLRFLPQLLCFGCITGPALTGLAGIATTGLVDHFDPAAGLLTNPSGQVTGWANQAAPARGVSAGSTATAVVTHASGRPLIAFNAPANGGALSYPAPGSAALAHGYTVMVVARLQPTANAFPRLHRGANDAHALFFRTATGEYEVKANPLASGSRPRSAPGAFASGNELVIVVARLTRTAQELYFNGNLVAAAMVGIDAYTIDNSTFEIGESVVGDIGHVLVYDQSASLQDINQTGLALAALYGLAWHDLAGDPDPEPRMLFPADAANARTLYRYRAFAGTQAPDTVSDYAAAATVLPAVTSVQRGAPGGPFHPFVHAVFNGGEQYVAQPFPEANALAGDFTITAWLRLQPGPGGLQTIVSTMDPAADSGISLDIVDGRIAASLWHAAGAGATLATLTTPAPLAPDTWRRVVCRYHRNADGSPHFLDIWIDHERVARAQLDAAASRVPSGLAPVFGADRAGAGGYDRHLRADLFAVQIDNYPLSDFYLEIPFIRDGSAYLGMIAHHDYLGLANLGGKLGGVPLERRVINTLFNPSTGLTRYAALEARLTGLWFLPFMNDDYVPQGFATDPEHRRVFMAYYHLTRDNVSYSYPSMIAEVFLEDGRLGNVFMLYDETGAPMTSHIGGIGYWNGFLFAPSSGSSVTLDPDLFAYDISAIPPAAFNPDTLAGFAPIPLPAVKRFRHPLQVLGEANWFNSLSFMGVHYGADQQPYLHLGNHQLEPRPTHIFKLGLAGDGSTREPVISEPATLLQSHGRAQGMAYYQDVVVGTQQIRRTLLASSYGNNNSSIYTASYVDGSAPLGSSLLLTMPAGLEDIGRIGNTLYGWSESGAVYYQKRASSPWTHLFPFMFAADISSLIDSNGKGVPDQWYAQHGIANTVDPRTDLDGDGYSILQEYLWDTNPRDAQDYPQVLASAQPVTFRLPTSYMRYYTLQRSTDLLDWVTEPGGERRRGGNAEWLFTPADPGADTPSIFYRVLIETD